MTLELDTSMRARGMRDLGPDEMLRIRAVEEAFARTCLAWGYHEVRTPVIEPLHLFTAAGTLSPKTLDGVYSFLDWDGWSGERVVLRPDSTIPAARLYAERLEGERPAKLFYRQSIFHFTDDGSSREEWQCGVELIGDTGLPGDAEIVLLALETLAPLGLPPITVRLSHAGLVRGVLSAARLSPEEQSAAYDRLLDGDLTAVEEIERRLPGIDAPLRLLFDVEGAGSGYIDNLRGTLGRTIPALTPALDDLAFVVRTLELRGVAPVVQSVLARSFEYYSGLVFKFYAGGQRICSGGRYDGLVELIGGSRVPACGFAHYLSPLVEALPAADAAELALRVVVDARDLDPACVAATYDAAAALRSAGISAEVAESMRSAPTHWLVVAGDKPRFTLYDRAKEQRAFDSIKAVLEALERAR